MRSMIIPPYVFLVIFCLFKLKTNPLERIDGNEHLGF